MRLEPEMIDQLDRERALHQTLSRRREQAASAGDLLLRPGTREQLVEQLVRQQRLHLGREVRPQDRPARRASAPLRSPYGLTPLHASAIRLSGLTNLLGIVVDTDLSMIHAYTEDRTFPDHSIRGLIRPVFLPVASGL
jgi:hypothetical protein